MALQVSALSGGEGLVSELISGLTPNISFSSGSISLPSPHSVWEKYLPSALQIARFFSPGIDTIMAASEVRSAAIQLRDQSGGQDERSLWPLFASLATLGVGLASVLLGSRLSYAHKSMKDGLKFSEVGEEILKKISGGEKNTFLVGRSASGKSRIFKGLEQTLRSQSIPIQYVDLQGMGDSSLMDYMNSFLERELGITPTSPLQSLSELDEILAQQSKRIVLLLDEAPLEILEEINAVGLINEVKRSRHIQAVWVTHNLYPHELRELGFTVFVPPLDGDEIKGILRWGEFSDDNGFKDRVVADLLERSGGHVGMASKMWQEFSWFEDSPDLPPLERWDQFLKSFYIKDSRLAGLNLSLEHTFRKLDTSQKQILHAIAEGRHSDILPETHASALYELDAMGILRQQENSWVFNGSHLEDLFTKSDNKADWALA